MKNVIRVYPAYNIIEAPINRFGIKCLKEGDQLALSNGHLHHYEIGSVIGDAVKENKDPIKELEHARKYNHELYYVFSLGTSISAHKQAKKEYIEISHGDIIYFAGKIFEIEPANNNNLSLKLIGEADYFSIAEIA